MITKILKSTQVKDLPNDPEKNKIEQIKASCRTVRPAVVIKNIASFFLNYARIKLKPPEPSTIHKF